VSSLFDSSFRLLSATLFLPVTSSNRASVLSLHKSLLDDNHSTTVLTRLLHPTYPLLQLLRIKIANQIRGRSHLSTPQAIGQNSATRSKDAHSRAKKEESRSFYLLVYRILISYTLLDLRSSTPHWLKLSTSISASTPFKLRYVSVHQPAFFRLNFQEESLGDSVSSASLIDRSPLLTTALRSVCRPSKDKISVVTV
jgi:hypothetical protein